MDGFIFHFNFLLLCSNLKFSLVEEEVKQEPSKVENDIPKIEITPDSTEANGVSPKKEDTETIQNGDIAEDKIDSSDIQENGEESPKGD